MGEKSSSDDKEKKRQKNNIDSCSFSFDEEDDVPPPCRIPDIDDIDGVDQYENFRPEKAPNLCMSSKVLLMLWTTRLPHPSLFHPHFFLSPVK